MDWDEHSSSTVGRAGCWLSCGEFCVKIRIDLDVLAIGSDIRRDGRIFGSLAIAFRLVF